MANVAAWPKARITKKGNVTFFRTNNFSLNYLTKFVTKFTTFFVKLTNSLVLLPLVFLSLLFLILFLFLFLFCFFFSFSSVSFSLSLLFLILVVLIGLTVQGQTVWSQRLMIVFPISTIIQLRDNDDLLNLQCLSIFEAMETS